MWSRRNGSGMRAHRIPGAISTVSPGRGGSGTGNTRGLSVLVSICSRLPCVIGVAAHAAPRGDPPRGCRHLHSGAGLAPPSAGLSPDVLHTGVKAARPVLHCTKRRGCHAGRQLAQIRAWDFVADWSVGMTEVVAEPKRNARGLVLLAVVVLAWGPMWPVNKALLLYMPPIWSIALRTCISALTLFAISGAVTGLVRPQRGDAPVLVSMVVLHMVGFTILSQLALQVVTAGRSTVLAYTSVLWAPIFAAVFLGERVSLRRAMGLALGLFGLMVIFNPVTFDWSNRVAVAGNAALLAAAMLWAASIVHNRSHAWRSTPFQLAPWQALLAAVIL